MPRHCRRSRLRRQQQEAAIEAETACMACHAIRHALLVARRATADRPLVLWNLLFASAVEARTGDN